MAITSIIRTQFCLGCGTLIRLNKEQHCTACFNQLPLAVKVALNQMEQAERGAVSAGRIVR